MLDDLSGLANLVPALIIHVGSVDQLSASSGVNKGAVMRENLLYIPLRVTEPVRISDGLRKCIENDYNQQPDKFSKDLDTVDQLRHRIIDLPIAVSSLYDLFNYNSQLFFLSTKFPSGVSCLLCIAGGIVLLITFRFISTLLGTTH